MGFDFGQIGGIVSNVMDTDYIDIRRDVDSSLVEVYSNIPCHIAYISIDNPDEKTVDIKPIVQGIRVHVPLWVDIRNNDFLIAKKVGSDGSLIATYSGRCGMPVVSQGRKKVMMEMSATEPYEPTPVPPIDPIEITISFLYGNEPISPEMVNLVENGGEFSFLAPKIEGYSFLYMLLDNETRIDTSTITLSNVTAPHSVKVVYEVSATVDSFRFLIKGLYTKDDGMLANGWHTYKSIPIDAISESEGTYTITSDNVVLEHRDNGKIMSIKVDALMVLYPNELMVKVKTVGTPQDGKVTFTAIPFTPTQEQANYYFTRWYD